MSTLKMFFYGAVVASLAIGGTVYRTTASSKCSTSECDAGVSCCAQEAACSAENTSSCGAGGCCASKASACCASGEGGACPAIAACCESATCPATQHEQSAASDNVVAEVEQIASESIAETATETNVEESPAGQ